MSEAWPPDYTAEFQKRQARLLKIRADPNMLRGAKAFYAQHPAEFICDFFSTYDPRNAGTSSPATMPFILFNRQKELVDFLDQCLKAERNGLVEKARDLGASWVSCAFSVWLWLFRPGSAIGWGSRKEQLVDRIGDPDSLFEKMRLLIWDLPHDFLPRGFNHKDHMTYMRIINPETGSTITGESGSNIGRGGRKLIYFKDEAAHFEHPEQIEAALSDNTRVQIDISSVNGTGNVFHRRREVGEIWVPGTELVDGRANVFIMDWRDHPAKTQAWYDERREKAEREGLLHIFAQEVDRDYAAAVEGIIIRPEWVRAAIDAHLVLKLPESGGWSGGLDVADGEGGDTNALAAFKGIVLRKASNWGDRDVGVTTRRALEEVGDLDIELQYDCIGVGAGVRSEANRLADEGTLPMGVKMIPWNAGAAVISPTEPMIHGDRDGPTNADMFVNMKAQAWWMVARRFENTYRAVNEGIEYEPQELISIDSTIPILRQIEKELSQATIKRRLSDRKMIVDKMPEGTKSPNVGDAIIMAAFPLTGLVPVFATAIPEFRIAPMVLPDSWPRIFTMKVEPEKTYVLWAAFDKHQDTLYVTTEHVRTRADPAVNAAAIVSRGKWIPGIIASDETNLEARRELGQFYANQGLNVALSDRSFEAGINDANQRISTARLKAFATCQDFFASYRAYRRDPEGAVLGGGLMDCLRLLCRPTTIQMMKVKPKVDGWGREIVPGMPQEGHFGDRKIGY